PSSCPCCGGVLRKLGEDVTETLELVPRQWKVIQHVREKFSCRSCEAITQPPAPSHPIARGRAGAGLLAHILFSKYGLHLPLNRQSTVYAREGVDLDVSTLADWVGAAAATLMPLVELIRAHVFAAERIHADDTTVPVLAKGKTRTGRLWTYVRDDRPFAGPDPPAAVFFYSPDRTAKHPEQHLANYAGLMQADAYAGFNRLYGAGRKPAPIIEAACWAHARRQFFDLARPRSLAARAARQALWPEQDRQGDCLQPHPLGCAHSLPRRRPFVHVQQCGRARDPRRRTRPQELDLRRLRRRRPPCRGNLHADPDRQAQRRRSASLARGRPCPPAGSSGQAHRRAPALELEARPPATSSSVAVPIRPIAARQ